MKSPGQRSISKPSKAAAPVAAAAARPEHTRTPALAKVHDIRGPRAEKSDRAKAVVGAKSGRQTSVFAAFAGSGVTAHDAVMKGVSGRALTGIWDSTKGTLPTEAVLKAIGVSARTAHRIKTDPDRPLDARTTDGIYRLASVRALAEEVLGSAAAADEWLNTEAMGLAFRKPLDLVSTSPGAEAVKTLLQRMKHGVYA